VDESLDCSSGETMEISAPFASDSIYKTVMVPSEWMDGGGGPPPEREEDGGGAGQNPRKNPIHITVSEMLTSLLLVLNVQLRMDYNDSFSSLSS